MKIDFNLLREQGLDVEINHDSIEIIISMGGGNGKPHPFSKVFGELEQACSKESLYMEAKAALIEVWQKQALLAALVPSNGERED